MNFKDFIKKRNSINECQEFLTEGFKKEDFKKVFKLVGELLKKNVDGKVLIDRAPIKIVINNDDYQSFFIFVAKDKKIDRAVSINYKLNAKTFDPYSVTFYSKSQILDLMWADGDAKKVKASLEINFMGASLVYYLPVIYHVLNTGDYSLSETKIKDLAGKIYDKSVKEYYHNFYIGSLGYKVFENVNKEKLSDIFKIKSDIAVSNGYDSILENELEDRKKDAYSRLKQAQAAGDKDLAKQVGKEYREILQAIKGGATSLADLNLSAKHNVSVSMPYTKEEQEVQKKLKDPDAAFKQMKAYVNAVIKGIQPGVILCGAPGVGKTYNVLLQLKAKGYINGQNLDIIKGKCTPRQLYLSLYNFKQKGKIVLIDDADSLVGPKATEDVINILKGALDSTTDDEGGRLVSYRVSGELKDDDGNVVPKTMSYAGSIIVITNYSVGQLDTALKGRTFIQSLEFTTQQMLDIVKAKMASIDPVNISPKAKIQAYEYLSELAEKGANMEISIRTFAGCARIFQLGEDPENELTMEDMKEMIAEQMAGQFARGGKKY